MKEWRRARWTYIPDIKQDRRELEEEDLEPEERLVKIKRWRGILLLKPKTTSSQKTFTFWKPKNPIRKEINLVKIIFPIEEMRTGV
jgi:hypothetical protein